MVAGLIDIIIKIAFIILCLYRQVTESLWCSSHYTSVTTVILTYSHGNYADKNRPHGFCINSHEG